MELKGKHTKLLAAMGLVLTTMIWGSSFVVMKNSVNSLPPTYLLALRFSSAAVVLCMVFHRSLKNLCRRSLYCGIILGIFLELSYLFQTYGLKYTTASKNAFITTLYVIIVPFLHWMLNKKRPGRNNMAAAGLAVVGLALLSLQGDLTINFGDFLTLLCGISFGIHMVLIDRYTEDYDPVLLTVLQVAVVGILNWCLAPFLDGVFDYSCLAGPALIGSVVYLAIPCTVIGFLLQNIGQKYLSANTSSILLSMESVFGAVFSVIFLKEVLTGRMLTGCVFMFLAVILSEYKPKGGWKGNRWGNRYLSQKNPASPRNLPER